MTVEFRTRSVSRLALLALGAVALAGCASTKVARQPVATGHLPRHAHIWVSDFAATAAYIPAGSALHSEIADDGTPQTPEEIEHGRALGALIATELVESIRAMGMPAAHATVGTSGEKTGSSKVEGRARQIAKGIAEVLEKRFREQGWIR